MIERWINDIVNYQIHNKRISVSDREIYQYGYYILFEKIIAVILTICIAALMDAWWEIMGFCIGFIPLRVYSGGGSCETVCKLHVTFKWFVGRCCIFGTRVYFNSYRRAIIYGSFRIYYVYCFISSFTG